MVIVAIAWSFVVLMLALAEATAANGTLLGAAFTVLLWGVLPLSIVLYLMNAPYRRRMRREAQAAERLASGTPLEPDGGGHAAGDTIAPEREEA